MRRDVHARSGDAFVRRQVAQWRRLTAKLQTLVNTGAGGEALACEAHALSRQCERLAAELACLATQRQSAAVPLVGRRT